MISPFLSVASQTLSSAGAPEKLRLIPVPGDGPGRSLERSTALSSRGHQPLQQPPTALEVQPLRRLLLSHHNVSRSGVCGPLPERHTLMPIGAVSGLRSLFKHLPLPRPLGGSRTLTFSLKTGAYHSTFF